MTLNAHLFATYNAGIRRARNAYRADQAVERGMCAICQTRPARSDEGPYYHRRICESCRKSGRSERQALNR
jgi:hypothetical protein